MTTLIKTYIRLLHERPFVTNVMTTCTLMVSGDLISQTFFQHKDSLDLKQTIRFGVAGLLIVGPAVRGSLVLIDKFFGPTNSILTLAKKLSVDQCLCAPSFTAINLTFLSFMKLGSIDEALEETKQSYSHILKMNYSFWPFIQVINFYYIPLTYRVLFGSMAALGWNCLLSYKLNPKFDSDKKKSTS